MYFYLHLDKPANVQSRTVMYQGGPSSSTNIFQQVFDRIPTLWVLILVFHRKIDARHAWFGKHQVFRFVIFNFHKCTHLAILYTCISLRIGFCRKRPINFGLKSENSTGIHIGFCFMISRFPKQVYPSRNFVHLHLLMH